MDKAEYKIKLEQINALAEAGNFREAAEAADEIDWRHVKSVRTLSMIGEIYEANRQYDESIRILKYAYRRSINSKTVLYRLAELDIKTGNYDEAKKFINEFEQNSPNDTSRYILKYKLLRAEKAPYDDQIEVLRNYRDTEYTERWAYELARLYKKNGQKEKCIEECDDMILWFSEGRYVQKALELKMSLTELTPSQKALYETNKEKLELEKAEAERAAAAQSAPAGEASGEEAPAASPADEVRELNPVEIVEKAVREIDDEDEESRPKVSAEEAISKMDTAAAGLAASERSETVTAAPEEERAAVREEKKKEPAEKKPNRILGGLKAVFSGIRRAGESVGTEDKEIPSVSPEASEAAGGEIAAEEIRTGVEGEAIGFAADLEESVAQQVSAAAGEAAEEELGFAADLIEEGSVSAAATVKDAEAAAKAAADAAGEAAAETAEEAGEALSRAEEGVKTAAEDAWKSVDETAGGVWSEIREEAGEAGEALQEAAETAKDLAQAAVEIPEETAGGAQAAGEAGEIPAETAGTEGAEASAAPDLGELDLDKLFAETGSAFASEVASGRYTMADTIEEEQAEKPLHLNINTGTIPQEIPIPGADEIQNSIEARIDHYYIDDAVTAAGEEAASEPEAPESFTAGEQEEKEDRSSLYARETDESLGLTREFHIKDELDRVLAGQAESENREDAPLPDVLPEKAARKAVIEAHGGVYDETEDTAAASAGPEAGYGAEPAGELPAEEEDVPEIPEEAPQEVLMNLNRIDETPAAGGADPIEAIAEVPEYFTEIPVEGRLLTDMEKKALSYFAQIPGVDYQITSAVADIHNNCGDRTSRSGNVLIMGRMGSGKTRLAESLVRIVGMHLGLKAVRMAKIVAEDFNQKNPAAVVKKLAGGFLIIEAAGALSDDAIAKLNQAMEFRTDDLIVILEDERDDLLRMLETHPGFAAKFTSTITVPVFTNDELVSFGKIYADDEGYKLDEMATLALYTMIGDNQKDAEPVTIGMVREMIDKAIDRSSRKFRFGKAEKEGGKVVLREKDFSF